MARGRQGEPTPAPATHVAVGEAVGVKRPAELLQTRGSSLSPLTILCWPSRSTQATQGVVHASLQSPFVRLGSRGWLPSGTSSWAV